MEQDMIKRLKVIIDYFKISPSKLADDISMNRSRLSHILNGRNNPSLEVIQQILIKYNDINPDWLLFGHGAMIRPGIEHDPRDLFQYAEINKNKKQADTDRKKTESSGTVNTETAIKKEVEEDSRISVVETEKSDNFKIKRITVYYSKNEYQDFTSE
jgi:transcriptional regulator with XRE-family HTH domain